MLKITVENILDERSIIDKLWKQIHIINKLKINMFLKSDILSSEKIIINYHCEVLILHYYREITVTMIIISIK